jgi:hypothetical protein
MMFRQLLDRLYSLVNLQLCDECSRPAAWVRQTQFSGDHYLCQRHAEQEGNIGQEDPSYFGWKKLV